MSDFNSGGQVQPQSSGMAVASLVLGILSILFVWIPIVGLVAWVLAPPAPRAAPPRYRAGPSQSSTCRPLGPRTWNTGWLRFS